MTWDRWLEMSDSRGVVWFAHHEALFVLFEER